VRFTLSLIRHALAEHPEIGRSDALDDVLLLEFALAGLKTGEVGELVQPGPRGNRLADSFGKVQLRRLVLQSCEHLIASKMQPKRAYSYVAGMLFENGMRAPRSKSPGSAGLANLVKRWHQAAKPGRKGYVEREDDAVWLKRMAMPAVELASAQKAVRRALNSRVVRKLIPGSA
jgi:hypothetical protein